MPNMTRPPEDRHTKQEKEILGTVRDHYSSARNAIHNNCYWDYSTAGEVSDTVGSGGGDWRQRWDLQEKMYTMWFERPSRDEFSSNVKSPMTSGRVDSAIQKFKQVDLQYIVRPEDSGDSADKRKADIVETLLNNLFHKGQFKGRLTLGLKDALIHGVSFFQVYYLRKRRKVKVQITEDDVGDLTDKQKKKLKDGKRVYKEEERVEYDDIALEPVKIQEIYVDPSARYLHGESYEAQYVIRRMLPSMAQFKSMFEDDPDAKNVDKVRPGSAYTEEDQEFFKPPQDIGDDDYVEVLHYYNKPEDKYVVTANDVVIKDMPLPYNHKQLPFVMVSMIKNPHQLYAIGIPDKLLPIQTEEEILKNLTYDRLHLTSNPMLKVNKSIYGDFSKKYQRAQDGLMLPVNDKNDVTPLEYPTMNFDTFRAIDALNRDAVLATQIDPIQMGTLEKYVSATTSMITKEQMDGFIHSLVENMTEALSIAGRQMVSLMGQFYVAPKLKAKLGDDTPGSRKVRLEGVQINPDTLEIKTKSAGDYSFLEIKKDYFDITGDWDIRIDPESVKVVSKALEAQKSQANIAQLAPFMVDPQDEKAMAQHGQPWIDGPKTVSWYLDKNDIPRDLLSNPQEDDDIAMKRAEQQGKRMLKGETVPGIPGEPASHKEIHVKQLRAQNKKVSELEGELSVYGEFSEVYMDQMPMGQELEQAKELARVLAMHLSEDDKPKVLREETEIEKTAKSEGVQVPMPPGMNQTQMAQPPSHLGGGQMGAGRPPEMGLGAETGRPSLYNQEMRDG